MLEKRGFKCRKNLKTPFYHNFALFATFFYVLRQATILCNGQIKIIIINLRTKRKYVMTYVKIENIKSSFLYIYF